MFRPGLSLFLLIILIVTTVALLCGLALRWQFKARHEQSQDYDKQSIWLLLGLLVVALLSMSVFAAYAFWYGLAR